MTILEGQVRDGTEAAEQVGDTGPIGLDTDMSQRVRIAGPATGATNARATGTLTTAAGAGSTVQIATGGCSCVTADVPANTNVTIVIEGQFANGSWAAINGYHPNTGAAIAGFVGTTGQCSIPCGGMTAVRMRASVVGVTPTATVKLEAGPGDAGKATEATLGALNAKVTACNTAAVVVSSSALPAGSATEATLATLATQATLAALNALSTTPGTATAIVKSDVTDTTALTAKGILVGGAGNLVVDGVTGGTDVVIPVVAGQFVPVRAAKVKAATTATGLVGLS